MNFVRQTDRWTDGQTDRQTESDTYELTVLIAQVSSKRQAAFIIVYEGSVERRLGRYADMTSSSA